MGWIRRTEDIKSHLCKQPNPERDGVWQCDECGQIWQCTYFDPQTYDFINDRPYGKIWGWRKI